jgi:hypothetical protein
VSSIAEPLDYASIAKNQLICPLTKKAASSSSLRFVHVNVHGQQLLCNVSRIANELSHPGTLGTRRLMSACAFGVACLRTFQPGAGTASSVTGAKPVLCQQLPSSQFLCQKGDSPTRTWTLWALCQHQQWGSPTSSPWWTGSPAGWRQYPSSPSQPSSSVVCGHIHCHVGGQIWVTSHHCI